MLRYGPKATTITGTPDQIRKMLEYADDGAMAANRKAEPNQPIKQQSAEDVAEYEELRGLLRCQEDQWFYDHRKD